MTTYEAGTRPPQEIQKTNATLPPLRASDSVRGSTDPKAVTIVEFADYTCVYCRATEDELVQILNDNSNVRHIWRDMPVTSDKPDAILASLAGRCAKEQNRFWEMHEQLMSISRITLETLRETARGLGLDTNAFSSCLASAQKLQEIQSDVQIARDHGLTSAPTFFIGNQVLTGYQTVADLRWAVLRASWSRSP